jgi:hypothetical protein
MYINIIKYSGFAWLIRRGLDSMMEFIGLLYNWLQQFTNHWNTVIFRLDTPMDLTSNSSQRQSHIATDGQSVSKSWCRAPSGAHDQIFITVWQLRSCFVGSREAGVCLLYMLLALVRAVFLGSESLGTRDHILLPLILGLPFLSLPTTHRVRWRYSTPPSHEFELSIQSQSHITTDGQSVRQSIQARNNRTGVARGVFYVSSHILIAKERLNKHVPANTQQ